MRSETATIASSGVGIRDETAEPIPVINMKLGATMPKVAEMAVTMTKRKEGNIEF